MLYRGQDLADRRVGLNVHDGVLGIEEGLAHLQENVMVAKLSHGMNSSEQNSETILEALGPMRGPHPIRLKLMNVAKGSIPGRFSAPAAGRGRIRRCVLSDDCDPIHYSAFSKVPGPRTFVSVRPACADWYPVLDH